MYIIHILLEYIQTYGTKSRVYTSPKNLHFNIAISHAWQWDLAKCWPSTSQVFILLRLTLYCQFGGLMAYAFLISSGLASFSTPSIS